MMQGGGSKRLLTLAFSLLVVLFFFAAPAVARDAAFLDPGASSGGMGEEAVKVDPKAEIDMGEVAINVAKHASVFFVNQTNLPVKIEKVVINGDSNVTAEASANDCTKQGSIAALSRCSIEVSATPTGPGAWSVDVLMTHNGAGRITRARLTGKTSGASSSENKSTGLAVNSKEAKPVDFGDVTVGDGKIVRSTLMVNDSPDPITIYAIDVIEADNGLQRLDQGCAVDMELPPGASCPVTLLWVPKNNGPVSTDLIIRHSGKLGFAVIPVRGMAKGGEDNPKSDGKTGGADQAKKGGVPLPPSAQDLDKEMANHIAPVPESALGGAAGAGGSKAGMDGSVHLIGTIGDRAIILKPNGETATVSIGDEFDVHDKTAKLVTVNARSADIVLDGKRKTLPLEAASSLVAQAAEQARQDASGGLKVMPASTSSAPQSVSLQPGGGVRK